jgi:hypothetical protein
MATDLIDCPKIYSRHKETILELTLMNEQMMKEESIFILIGSTPIDPKYLFNTFLFD